MHSPRRTNVNPESHEAAVGGAIAARIAPERTVHFLDVENVCGSGIPSKEHALERLELYANAAGLRAGDFGFAAASRQLQRNLSHDLPSGLRWIPAGVGPDAADRALMGAIDLELLAGRFGRVIIGSGDHSFVDPVARLVEMGVESVVVAPRGSVSHRLAAVATQVTYLPAA